MKRMNFIKRAFVSTLSERAVNHLLRSSNRSPYFKTQPQSASARNYKAGVSIHEFLSADLGLLLFPTLCGFGKCSALPVEFDHNRVNARRVQFSR
jgi:hypothetical protein